MDQAKRKRLSTSDVLNVFTSNKKAKTAVEPPPARLETRPPGKLRRMASRDALNGIFKAKDTAADALDQPGNRQSMFDFSTVPLDVEAAAAAAQPSERLALKKRGSIGLLFRKTSMFGLNASNNTELDAVSPRTVAGPGIESTDGGVERVHATHPGEIAGTRYMPSVQVLESRAVVTEAMAHRIYVDVATKAPKLAAAQGNPPQLSAPVIPAGSFLYTNENGVPWPMDVQVRLKAAAAKMARDAANSQLAVATSPEVPSPQSLVRRQRAATCASCDLNYHQIRAMQWELDYQATGRAPNPVDAGIDLQTYGYLWQQREEQKRNQQLAKEKRIAQEWERIDSCAPASLQSPQKLSSNQASSAATQQTRPPCTDLVISTGPEASPDVDMTGRESAELHMSGGLGVASELTVGKTRQFSSTEVQMAETDQMSIVSSRFQPEDLDAVMAALSFAESGYE